MPIGSIDKQTIKSNQRNVQVVLAILVVVGLVLIGVFYIFALEAQRTAEWPTVEGTVVDAYLTGDGEYYHPSVVYEFQVDGVNHSSDRISTSIQNTNIDLPSAQSYLDRYPIGSSVTIHYDPNDPTSAVIETGVGWWHYIPLIVGVGFLVIPVAAILAGRYQMRKSL